ncbi:anhydro-N-acetylmuramic acid kinase [Oscillatoria amoena NRMC-F 0135]|nr:anhydro-N-acetylmuramic acid kinase [Oscillatoria amoena NRMC-F 0135]
MSHQDQYDVIGIMSGTSLDGVDLAYCSFIRKGSRWRYTIHEANTYAYNRSWKKILSTAHQLPGAELMKLHALYGHYLGNLCNTFCRQYSIKKTDFISSHGHTVYHQPNHGFTFQLGDGNAIHSTSGKKVVCDFRSLDVARGGEGAPLVPVGDHLLFSDYDVCLNLGGIANCSMLQHKKRVAFDICFVNMTLNYLAEQVGKKYDKDGKMASAGVVDKHLLKRLQSEYTTIRKERPSLGREIFERQIRPLLDHTSASVPDIMATVVESIAMEISQSICDGKRKSVFCTGGGAFNAFLMYRLLDHVGDRVSLVVPETSLISFKEAVVFGLLGVLRVRNEINCLRSVTGAVQDSSTGILVGF